MDRVRVVAACMLGTVIGGLTLSIFHQYLWWIGMIIGGFAGYIFCEPEKTLSAIRIAWKAVVGYKPDKQGLIVVFWVLLDLFISV